MSRTQSIVARVVRRFADERGIALAAAVGISTTLMIAGTSVMAYTTANNDEARYSSAGVAASALADTGVHNALATLSARNVNPANPYLLPPRSAAYAQGTATWWGTLDEASGVWTVTGRGEVQAASGGKYVTVRRTSTATVPVNPVASPATALSWNFIYARNRGPSCDVVIGNSVQVGSPLYVNGNLCLQNTATITRGPLFVNGYLSMSQTANAVGSSSAPISDLEVAGGCRWTSNPLHKPCINGPGTAGGDNVWASKVGLTPDPVTAPTVDWNGWYLNASPGPYFPCAVTSGVPPVFDNDQGPRTAPDATKRNNSLNTSLSFNLTPAASYTCKTELGELSWNATTRVLTISGTVFIDGSAQVQNGLVNTYAGQGTLYLSGTFLVKNSKLCAVVTSDGANCTTTGWTPNSQLLAIAANGNGSTGGAAGQVLAGDSVQLVSAQLQAAVYATNIVDIDTTSRLDGPINASTVKLGQSSGSAFPTFSSMPAGMPGQTATYPTLGSVVFYGA